MPAEEHIERDPSGSPRTLIFTGAKPSRAVVAAAFARLDALTAPPPAPGLPPLDVPRIQPPPDATMAPRRITLPAQGQTYGPPPAATLAALGRQLPAVAPAPGLPPAAPPVIRPPFEMDPRVAMSGMHAPPEGTDLTIPSARRPELQRVQSYTPQAGMEVATGAITHPMGAFMGAMLDRPGDLGYAAQQGWGALAQLPEHLWNPAAPALTSPGQEAMQRNPSVGPWSSMVMDMALDPSNLLGGGGGDDFARGAAMAAATIPFKKGGTLGRIARGALEAVTEAPGAIAEAAKAGPLATLTGTAPGAVLDFAAGAATKEAAIEGARAAQRALADQKAGSVPIRAILSNPNLTTTDPYLATAYTMSDAALAAERFRLQQRGTGLTKGEVTRHLAMLDDAQAARAAKRTPRVEVGNVGAELQAPAGTRAAYQPASGRVMLDRESVAKMTPTQRAETVRHELTHKIDTESELWKDSDTTLWNLWETEQQHPLWDFMGERTGRSRFDNNISPEIVAELYATEYPKGTFTVKDRPVPYASEAGQVGPREYPIPPALMRVLDQVEDKLGIWGKKRARGTATLASTAARARPAVAAVGGDAATTLKDTAALAKTQQLQDRYPRLARYFGKHETALNLAGANRSPAAALDRMTQEIHARTLTEPGTTTRPFTGEIEIPDPQNQGYIFGKYSNQSGKTQIVPLADFTPKTIAAFMEQHAEALAKNPDLAIGTWRQTDAAGNVNVYLDVSEKAGSRRKAVVTAANEAQPKTLVRDPVTGAWPKAQEAVFNLKTGKDQPVGNLAEFLGSPEFQGRLDEMYQAGVPVMNGKEWWNLYGGPLERVYGKERVAPLAALLASTSPASAPVHNLRSASEYLRRLIKNEPIIQPDFRIPETAVGSREGMMGAMTPGDYNSPGTLMPMETTRAPNLQRAAAGDYANLQKDKVNDMFHALTGEDVGVYDRRYAKLAEDWDRGIYVDATKDKVPGTMGSGKVSPYALIENAVRTGAARHKMSLGRFSAYVWEGIGDTIKKTGELYGMKHSAHSIPTASQGFAGIFEDMIAEKAKAWGVTVAEFEQRLRNGDAELLTAILATPAGVAAYQQWQQAHPSPGSPRGSM